jgi:hypothetical protein
LEIKIREAVVNTKGDHQLPDHEGKELIQKFPSLAPHVRTLKIYREKCGGKSLVTNGSNDADSTRSLSNQTNGTISSSPVTDNGKTASTLSGPWTIEPNAGSAVVETVFSNVRSVKRRKTES